MWLPNQYLKFRSERARPFFDLLSQVESPDLRMIADLGCGPGELTAALAERWQAATVYGIDNSPEMIAAAQAYAIPDRLTFHLADLATWVPPAPLDLVVSNAALQWIPGHKSLIPRLANLLAPRGWLAIQIPGFFKARAIFEDLSDSPRWQPSIGHIARLSIPSNAGEYIDLLAPLGFEINAWDTTYHHVLQGEDAVLEWVKGTLLRPVLAALDPGEAAQFLEEYGGILRAAYPRLLHGTVLPFTRHFIVARRE